MDFPFIIKTIKENFTDAFLIFEGVVGEDIDLRVLDYFIENKMISKKITTRDKEEFLQFNSEFYGRNNLFINTTDHYECLKFQIDRFSELLNNATKQYEYLSSKEMKNTEEIGKYIFKLKDRLLVLDKMMKSVL